MSKQAAKRITLCKAQDALLLEASELLQSIEEERPGTVLLDRARALAHGIRPLIDQCQSMPVKNLPDAMAAHYVALHVKKAASYAYSAARNYPMESFLADACSFCGMAVMAAEQAAVRAKSRAANGNRMNEGVTANSRKIRTLAAELAQQPGSCRALAKSAIDRHKLAVSQNHLERIISDYRKGMGD